MKKVIFCFALIYMALAGYTQELVVGIDDFYARSGYTERELEDITMLFEGFLALTGEVIVVSRGKRMEALLKAILEEKSQNILGEELVVQPKFLEAQIIIKGELIELGSHNILYMRLLDVESSGLISSIQIAFESLDDLLNLLPSLANDVVKLLKK
jgi:hypothetical protein